MNENNNQELNTISLGNVDNNGDNSIPNNDIPPVPVTPTEQVNPVSTISPEVESLDNPMSGLDNNSTQVAQDINPVSPVQEVAPVEPMPTVEPVVPQDNSIYEIPQTINEFNTTPVFNDIGTVPPIPNMPSEPIKVESNEPKKKQGSKLLFILIVLLAIAAVGVGVYIFLNITNKTITLKYVKLEVGSTVSTKITDYAAFKNIDSSTCSLDTSNITDTSIYDASYTYKIVCDGKTYTGNVKIVDTTKPEVTLKENVTVQVNGTITPEDFVLSCKDSTKCSYEFKDEVKVAEYLKTAESYKVPIIVKDEALNSIEVTATLIVSDTVANRYLVLTKKMENYIQVEQFGFKDDEFLGSDVRKYIYNLTDAEYSSFKNSHESNTEVTYKEITGKVSYDDAQKAIIITKELTIDELNKELKANLATDISSLRVYFVDLGYDWTYALSI